jgi:hypothetical protein
MKKFLIICFVALICYPVINAQSSRNRQSSSELGFWKLRRYEVSAGLGLTQFFGDLGGFSKGKNFLGFKDLSFKQTSFDFSPSFKYRITEEIAVRLNLALGKFHSSDARGSNIERSFESSTFFFEPLIIGEYFILKSQSEASYSFQKGKGLSIPFFTAINLYAFTGFGGISYHVTPKEIQVTGTIKTRGFAPVIPVGIGASLPYSGQLSFGLEISGRYAFTDYLDGYSSIYSKSNDIYYFINVSITYKIRTGKTGWPSFR